MNSCGGPVEVAAAILPLHQIAARAQAQAIAQRVLVLRPAGDDDAHARACPRVDVALEGQVIDVDNLLLGGRAQVAVRRKRDTGAVAPALARPHRGQKAVDVGGHHGCGPPASTRSK